MIKKQILLPFLLTTIMICSSTTIYCATTKYYSELNSLEKKALITRIVEDHAPIPNHYLERPNHPFLKRIFDEIVATSRRRSILYPDLYNFWFEVVDTIATRNYTWAIPMLKEKGIKLDGRLFERQLLGRTPLLKLGDPRDTIFDLLPHEDLTSLENADRTCAIIVHDYKKRCYPKRYREQIEPALDLAIQQNKQEMVAVLQKALNDGLHPQASASSDASELPTFLKNNVASTLFIKSALEFLDKP